MSDKTQTSLWVTRIQTWLCNFNIKYFLHMSVIGSDLEYSVGCVLDAGNIDWHNILRNPLPAHVLSIPMDSENLSP